MFSQCTDIMAAMVLSYILSGVNSDGSGCWEWSWNICYLNREAVKAWIEKRSAYSPVLVWSPATLTLPGKIVTRHSFSTSLGLLWKCIYADADGPNYDLRQTSSCCVRQASQSLKPFLGRHFELAETPTLSSA